MNNDHFTGADKTRSGVHCPETIDFARVLQVYISIISADGRLTKLKTFAKMQDRRDCQAICAGRHKDACIPDLFLATLFSTQNSPNGAAPFTSGIPAPAHASTLVQCTVVPVSCFNELKIFFSVGNMIDLQWHGNSTKGREFGHQSGNLFGKVVFAHLIDPTD